MAIFSGNFLNFSSEKETLNTSTRPDSSYVNIDLYDSNYARITLDYGIDQSVYKKITSYHFTPPYTADDHVDEIDIYAYDKDGVRTTILSSNTDYTSERNYSGGINDLPENCVRITCMVILEDPGSTYNFSSTFRGDWQAEVEEKDLESPSRPKNLTIVGFSENTLNLIWSPSTDNVGVVGYKVYLDDVLITTVIETNYTFTGLEGGTLYSLSVIAIDAAGNESAKNSIQARTFFKHSNLILPNENPFMKEVFNYIRDMVNEFRNRNGLDPINWTDSTIIKGVTPIKATHWNEIEDAILDVYTQLNIEMKNPEAKQQFEETILSKNQLYPLNLLPRRIENIIKGLENS
ncbi:fibronectin type III domain-containing protein [Chengkuizengella sp. SCS-71B]|uniref:fibronectin type III domain-containing protein n=1 Tax=Chengkuizengella sp. SCS-71B TaxID=3115290 RepID=UPI0032C22D9A